MCEMIEKHRDGEQEMAQKFEEDVRQIRQTNTEKIHEIQCQIKAATEKKQGTFLRAGFRIWTLEFTSKLPDNLKKFHVKNTLYSIKTYFGRKLYFQSKLVVTRSTTNAHALAFDHSVFWPFSSL